MGDMVEFTQMRSAHFKSNNGSGLLVHEPEHIAPRSDVGAPQAGTAA